jgi:hypothetical protein
VPHEIDGTLDKAVAAATRDAEASPSREPVVLLSPACASFDQYRNFEVRGDVPRAGAGAAWGDCEERVGISLRRSPLLQVMSQFEIWGG